MAGPGGTEVNRISIRVVPDTTGFRKTLKRELKSALAGFEQKVKIGVDTKGLRTKVQSAINEAVRGAAHKVELDVSVKRGEAAKVGKEVERAADAANPQVDVGVNTARFWREFEAMIRKAKGRTVNVDVTINRRVFTTRYTQEFKRVEREVYRYERTVRDILRRTTTESNRHADAMGNNNTRISDSFNNSVTNIRRGWLTMKRLLLIVAAAAGPALGLVAGLLAALPSLAMAGGLAIGAIALGLDGIKGAAESLKPELDELKSAVSGVFKQRLDQQFQQLKNSGLLADLTEGFRYVANGLMDMSQGFFDVITSAEGMRDVNTIMGGTARLFSDLKPFMADLTSGFLTLASSGAENFGKLSTTMNTWAADFKNTVARLKESGQLDDMFTGLSQAFDGFGVMFNRLFEAGVSAMVKLGQPIGNFLAQIGVFFQKAEPILSAFSAAILNIGSQILASLGPIFEKLTPALTELLDLLGTGIATALEILGTALEPIATMINDVLIVALNAIKPILPELKVAFQELATAMSEALSSPEMKQALTDLVQNVLPQLVALLPEIIQAFTGVVTTIAPLIPAFVHIADIVLSTVIPALRMLYAVMTGDFETAWAQAGVLADNGTKSVTDAIQGMIPAALGYLGDLLNTFTDWGNQLVSLLKTAGWNAMASFIDGLLEQMGPLGDALKQIADAVSGTLGGGETQVLIPGGETGKGVAKKLATDFSKELQNGLNENKDWVYDGGYATGGAAGQGVADGMEDKLADIEKMRKQVEAAAGLLDSTYSSMLASGKKDQDPLKIFGERAEKLQDKLYDLAIEMQVLEAVGDQGDPDQFLKDMAKISAEATATQNELNALNGMMDTIYQQRRANDPFRDVTNLLDIGKTDWPQMLQQLGLAPADAKPAAQIAGEKYADGFALGFGTIEDKFKAMINRFGESQGIEDIVGKWDKAIEDSKLDTLGEDFLKEQSNEFFGDLGFGSGSGFIGQAIDNVPSIVYNVSSVDEVNTNERNRLNRKKYQYTGV